MKTRKSGGELEKLEMNMTPMIDVCFQLIIFFMLSLRLYSPEGDFNVKMPVAAPRQTLPDDTQTPPIQIRLRSDRHGNLAGIQMGQRSVANFAELRRQVLSIVGADRGPAAASSNAEVELDCDYELKFEYVIDALTAVVGYLADDRQSIVHLIDKIRFTQPKK
ncbi:MAG: biopolymer transporter ExbD [Thermoguttaceae bacterium]